MAREPARRLGADPDTGELRLTRHGQLVMDWVEVFAPVVFEAESPDRLAGGGVAAARRSAVLATRPLAASGSRSSLLRGGPEHERPKL